MNLPSVTTTLIDKETGVTYHVMAYRKLSRNELIFSIRNYHATLKKKLKRGAVVRILTVFQ